YLLDVVALASLDDGDVTLLDKGVGRRHRGVEIAAGVVAKIDDKADQVLRLRLQILDRAGQGRLGARVEPGKADIANIAGFEMRGDRGEFYRCPLHLDLGGGAGAAPQGQRDLAVNRAAQPLLDLAQAQVEDRLLVD